jgi:hypothetical protein
MAYHVTNGLMHKAITTWRHTGIYPLTEHIPMCALQLVFAQVISFRGFFMDWFSIHLSSLFIWLCTGISGWYGIAQSV